MSAASFMDTWKRAKRARSLHPLSGSGLSIHHPPLEASTLEPTRYNAHPAQVLERALLELEDERFNALAPQSAQQIKPDQAAETGVAWIDELEKKLFKQEA